MTPAKRADLAESMVPVACDLTCRVRDADAEGIARLAEARGWDTETAALLIVLAAMVPDDVPVGDLLAWTDGLETVLALRQEPLPLAMPGRPVTELCGTYAAYRRHERNGEPADRECQRAYGEYHRKQSRESAARTRARAAAGDGQQRGDEAADAA